MNSGFYIVELPIITRKNGNHKKGLEVSDKRLHGDGCSYATHCEECPLPECKHIRKPTKQEIIACGLEV